jgi:DnaK suppressor protein
MDADHARELLGRERERIKHELEELKARRGVGDELSNVDQHTADVGSELFDAERDSSMIERLESELEAIARAEQRIDEGKYGTSVLSGKPIPDERLEAVPHTELTVEEQARFDAEQRNQRSGSR